MRMDAEVSRFNECRGARVRMIDPDIFRRVCMCCINFNWCDSVAVPSMIIRTYFEMTIMKSYYLLIIFDSLYLDQHD